MAEMANNYLLQRTSKPMEAAEQSARLQQPIINDLVDDARIQTNQLTLFLKS